ncbi:hypothetical protein F7725_001236 [Dissostichus mawsoni]|uniref:C-type lectin domain-containing protein n=1 Tax=Dissostichus mawsoni TaxID=36200 RepID=A0A7J5ZIR2_DISMA|nr:hypothetical protein F7725_001236 [Dissostichus mawsoni]
MHIYSLIPKEENREETRMEKVLLIIIALSGKRLSAVSSHAERQYHFVYEAKNMSEAQRYCREKHTDLATVDSMEVVKFLNNMAGQYNQSAWIGLYDDRDSWKWSMSDPSFYEPGKIEFRQWGSGEPGAWHHEQCTFVNSGGTWGDQDCNNRLRVICFDVTAVPVSMQVIKVRVEKPNGVDLNNKAFLDDMLVEAKKNLRAQGLDDNVQLAWRKQPDGQLHIYSLIPKERNREETRMEKVLLIIIVLSAWIGLHDDRDSWKWSMSDPSFYEPGEIEFIPWGPNQPDNWPSDQCTLIFYVGTWADYDCNGVYRAVCFDVTEVSKIKATSKQVMILSLLKKKTHKCCD